MPLEVESRGFPPGLAGVIGRALEKDLHLRYRSAAELGADLRRMHIAPASRPTAATVPAIPLPRGSFVGRVAELRLVAEALSKARLVTLTGPGGTGKTRLALRAADEFGRRSSACRAVSRS